MPDFDADEAAADMPIDIPDFDMAAPDETAADMPIDMPDFDMEAGDEGAADLPIDMPDFGADDEAAADMPIDMPDFGTDEAAADMPIDMPDFDMEAGDEAAAELPIDMPDFGADEAAGDMGDFALDEGADDAAADLPIDMPDFGDDLQSGGVAADAAGDMGDFALDESADDMGGFDTDPMNLGLDDLGLANDLSAMPEAEPADMGDFSIGEGFEDSGTAASEEMDLGSDDDFGMPEDDQAFGDGAFLEDGPGDSFDNFKLDSDALAGDFELDDGNGFGDEFDGFSIASIDDARAPRAGAKAKVSKDRPDDKNEINLSTDELELLLITLADYPLNLRIACEELIAEKVVAPEKLIQLLKLLIEGTPAEETASFAGKLLGRTIKIPRGHEKKTGEELEAEQSSFAYIFIHKFLPVFRLFLMIATVILCAGYLSWQFIVIPNRAERLYRLGLERIAAGEYSRANERFNEAYRIQPKKQWFYTYARAFRDARQYALAEEKYLQLLHFTASRSRRGIPEKAAVLEYADLHTNYIGNYEMADRIIRRNILDYFPFDQEALLALGDNALAWGEFEPERLEDARIAFATVIEIYGRTDPVLERMLKYLIRSDQLEHVLPLQEHFMASARRAISSATLAELGGYLLDKRFEEVRGVPNAYLDYIMGIRDVLFRAIRQEPTLPEAYYHLARYYHFFDSYSDERYTLELAIMAFEAAREENPRRLRYNIDTHRRYAELLIGRREFFPAEENLIKAINLYQDGLRRRLLTRSPEFGRLYAELGDLEFFVKEGNLQNALDYYWLAELNEWAPPEIQYRMGAVHYQLRQWGPAQDRLIEASREMPLNRRVLHALGNVSFMRGNYFAAQGYYDRLLTILEDDRSRLPPIEPTDSAPELDLAERMMVVQNNLGVTLEALTDRTGDNRYRSRVQALYSDSARAWDILTRNPESFIRMRPAPDLFAPGINPAYLNIQNNLYPVRGFEPHFFLRIDRDALEPSQWEELAPPGFRLSEGLHSGR
ncbi:MAG: tetratricopeptide repeat protein [Treponema sp.]|nr:tetratricopeptide repeat protein [Treponema sp.]